MRGNCATSGSAALLAINEIARKLALVSRRQRKTLHPAIQATLVAYLMPRVTSCCGRALGEEDEREKGAAALRLRVAGCLSPLHLTARALNAHQLSATSWHNLLWRVAGGSAGELTATHTLRARRRRGAEIISARQRLLFLGAANASLLAAEHIACR